MIASVHIFVEKRGILFVAAASVVSIATLVSGAPILSARIPGGIPFGNVLSVFPFFLPAFLAIVISQPRTLVRRFSIASLAAAVSWLPVSFGLAGNLNLNFSGTRGEAWIWLSLVTAVLTAIALVWAMIDSLFRWRRKKGLSNAAY
jgi:hypothetical protein